MNPIGRCHEILRSTAPSLTIGVLCDAGVADRVRLSLGDAQGSRRPREHPLAPSLTFWLVLALAIHRSLSIPNVFATLLSAWRATDPRLSLHPVTDGALAHARERLGPEPLRRFFEMEAGLVQPPPSFHGRRVWAADCVCETTPDTPANVAAFGRPSASKGRSAFPQVRVATLTSTRTHEIGAACWAPFATPERPLVARLLGRLGGEDLLLLDRGLSAVWLFARLERLGCAYVARLRSDLRPVRRDRRGPGDFEVVVLGSPDPDDPERKPSVVRARLLEFTWDGKETVRLLVGGLDPRIGALEFPGLYHERWECELGYDEVKTHLGAVPTGALHTVWRGRSPRLVEQEIWATLAAYNLVRRRMAHAARRAHLDARRISFLGAVAVLRAALPRVEAAPTSRLLAAHRQLLDDLADCCLDRWRRPRVAPRVIKIKTPRFPHKKAHHRSRTCEFLASLRMGAVA